MTIEKLLERLIRAPASVARPAIAAALAVIDAHDTDGVPDAAYMTATEIEFCDTSPLELDLDHGAYKRFMDGRDASL